MKLWNEQGAKLCLGAAVLLMTAPALASEDVPSPARQSDIIRLVRQDCGSCHGMTLSGGLGPALLPENLRDKPEESLVATVLYGRPGTPMPPWRPFLTEGEARWVVDQLMKGFPDGR